MNIKQYPIIDFVEILSHAVACVSDKDGPEEVESTFEEDNVSKIDLDKIKREAFIEGQNSIVNDTQKNENSYKDNLASLIEKLSKELEDIKKICESNNKIAIDQVIELSTVIAKKIAGASISFSGIDLIKDFLSQHLPELYSETLISVRMSPEHAKDIKRYTEDGSLSRIYNADIDIVFDEKIQLGDCVIEYNGGKIVREKANILRQIEKVINSYYNDRDRDEISEPEGSVAN